MFRKEPTIQASNLRCQNNQGGALMRTLLGGLFSLFLIGGATVLTTTDALAVPGENNGNHYGQIRNGNNGNSNGATTNGSVPIDGTLLSFGVGFVGLVAWQVISQRKKSCGTMSA